MLPSSPSSMYPKSQTQLNSLIQDYYELTLQVETLQRHILKIQTENQNQHKFFKDETEKLKLYIDQCQNQIRKREQRELLLIERLKQLQIQKLEDMQVLKSSRNFLKQNQDLKQECNSLIKSRQLEWNREKQSLIDNNQALMKNSFDLNKKINQMNQNINSLLEEKQNLIEKTQQNLSQLASSQSTIIKLKHDIEDAKKTIQALKQQNFNLTERVQNGMRQKETNKPTPISISSACPNCLKLSKLHEIQIQKKTKDIDCLKKDVECLMAFFEIPQ